MLGRLLRKPVTWLVAAAVLLPDADGVSLLPLIEDCDEDGVALFELAADPHERTA